MKFLAVSCLAVFTLGVNSLKLTNMHHQTTKDNKIPEVKFDPPMVDNIASFGYEDGQFNQIQNGQIPEQEEQNEDQMIDDAEDQQDNQNLEEEQFQVEQKTTPSIAISDKSAELLPNNNKKQLRIDSKTQVKQATINGDPKSESKPQPKSDINKPVQSKPQQKPQISKPASKPQLKPQFPQPVQSKPEVPKPALKPQQKADKQAQYTKWVQNLIPIQRDTASAQQKFQKVKEQKKQKLNGNGKKLHLKSHQYEQEELQQDSIDQDQESMRSQSQQESSQDNN